MAKKNILKVSDKFEPEDRERLVAAHERIAKTFRMLGRKALSLEIEPFTDGDVKADKNLTACVDGVRVRWNVNFVRALNDRDLFFVSLHEIMHVVARHDLRIWNLIRKYRNKFIRKLASQAADYEINWMIVNAGYPMVEGGLYDPRFIGKAYEEIYDILFSEMPEPNEPGEGEDDNPNGDGGSGEPGEAGGGGSDQNDPDNSDSEDSDDGGGGYELPDPKTWGDVEPRPADDGGEMSEEELADNESAETIEMEVSLRSEALSNPGKGSNPFEVALRSVLKDSKVAWRSE